jgi:hypothetical protein
VLKAANTLEATPQRARQKQSTAEEPVTARIRRRAEAGQSSEQPIQTEVAPGTAATVADSGSAAEKPPLSFRERILQERQHKTEGEGESPQ